MKPIDVLTGGEHSRCIARSECTMCGSKVVKFRDDLSAREYEISGLCQDCQNRVFDEEDYDADC